jgi:6,7-dimethyl-8-ribityllumazine synthase
VVAKAMAKSGQFDAVIAIGVVVRGQQQTQACAITSLVD